MAFWLGWGGGEASGVIQLFCYLTYFVFVGWKRSAMEIPSPPEINWLRIHHPPSYKSSYSYCSGSGVNCSCRNKMSCVSEMNTRWRASNKFQGFLIVPDLRSCTMLSTLPLFYIAQSVNSDDRRARFQGLRVIMFILIVLAFSAMNCKWLIIVSYAARFAVVFFAIAI